MSLSLNPPNHIYHLCLYLLRLGSPPLLRERRSRNIHTYQHQGCFSPTTLLLVFIADIDVFCASVHYLSSQCGATSVLKPRKAPTPFRGSFTTAPSLGRCYSRTPVEFSINANDDKLCIRHGQWIHARSPCGSDPPTNAVTDSTNYNII